MSKEYFIKLNETQMSYILSGLNALNQKGVSIQESKNIIAVFGALESVIMQKNNGTEEVEKPDEQNE